MWADFCFVRYGIKVIRRTFDQLSNSAEINSETFALTVHGFPADPVEVSVVYYRAGYGPADYPTAGHYQMRMILEQSRAIQCPSIALQLAGSKKVQQELTKPGVMERFLGNEGRSRSERVFSRWELVELKESWVTMWGLDEGPDEMSGLEGVDRARRDASNLVLKPQREGGGNNVYTDDIPAFLDALPPADRRAWIAMELIRPPEASASYLANAAGGGLLKSHSVSELGIFGYALFGYPGGKIKEKEVGWLVRTKQRNSNEGGVAAGFSFLDSLLLVNG
jgi:glutathione synthase